MRRLAWHVAIVITLVPFALALVLLSVNVLGFVISMRNPRVYQIHRGASLDVTMTPSEAFREMERHDGESEEQFARRMNHLVAASMANYWEDDGIDSYSLRVPLLENYLMYREGFKDKQYRKYEFFNYRKAIERGVGYCSQQVIALCGLLQAGGIRAEILGLEGHVVARVRAGGRWFVADPDYDVFLPFDIGAIEKNPKTIDPYYREALRPRLLSREALEATMGSLHDIYKSPGNRLYPGGSSEYLSDAYLDLERDYYVQKWRLPFKLMLPLAAVALLSMGSRALRRRGDVAGEEAEAASV